MTTTVEYRAFQGFTDLLEVHGPNLDFFDESIPFLTEPPSESIEDQISDAKSELRELKQEQRELSAIDSQQSLHDIKKIEDVSFTSKRISSFPKWVKILLNLKTIKSNSEILLISMLTWKQL